MQPFRSMASLTKAQELCHGQRRLLSKVADQEVPPTRHGVMFTARTQFTHVTTRHACSWHTCMHAITTHTQSGPLSRRLWSRRSKPKCSKTPLRTHSCLRSCPRTPSCPKSLSSCPRTPSSCPRRTPSSCLNSEELDGEELDEPDPEEERRAKQQAYHQMQRFKVSARAADFPQLARLLKRRTPAEKRCHASVDGDKRKLRRYGGPAEADRQNDGPLRRARGAPHRPQDA